MLAGLEEVNEGSIFIGDRDVTDVPPKDRDIAMVFQNYALYPHMTVAENMGFALKIAGVGKDGARRRVARGRASCSTSSEYLDRKPKALSGGQRQRVAMGRAIVRQPQVFLMDEPLSNLDAKLRVQTRTQIASLQRRLGVTTVYVTARPDRGAHHGRPHRGAEGRPPRSRSAPRATCTSRRTTCSSPASSARPAMNLFPADLAEGGVLFGDRRRAGRARQRSATRTAPASPSAFVPRTSWSSPPEGKGLTVDVDLVEELGADGYLYGTLDVEGKRTDIVARVDGRVTPIAGDTRVRWRRHAGPRARLRHRVGRAPQRQEPIVPDGSVAHGAVATVGRVGAPFRPRPSLVLHFQEARDRCLTPLSITASQRRSRRCSTLPVVDPARATGRASTSPSSPRASPGTSCASPTSPGASWPSRRRRPEMAQGRVRHARATLQRHRRPLRRTRWR